MRDVLSLDWLSQARRQIDASGGRPVVWVFAERDAADFARKLFDESGDLKRIHTLWIPYEGAAQ